MTIPRLHLALRTVASNIIKGSQAFVVWPLVALLMPQELCEKPKRNTNNHEADMQLRERKKRKLTVL